MVLLDVAYDRAKVLRRDFNFSDSASLISVTGTARAVECHRCCSRLFQRWIILDLVEFDGKADQDVN